MPFPVRRPGGELGLDPSGLWALSLSLLTRQGAAGMWRVPNTPSALTKCQPFTPAERGAVPPEAVGHPCPVPLLSSIPAPTVLA